MILSSDEEKELKKQIKRAKISYTRLFHSWIKEEFIIKSNKAKIKSKRDALDDATYKLKILTDRLKESEQASLDKCFEEYE